MEKHSKQSNFFPSTAATIRIFKTRLRHFIGLGTPQPPQATVGSLPLPQLLGDATGEFGRGRTGGREAGA